MRDGDHGASSGGVSTDARHGGAADAPTPEPPLICHVVYRFDTGGLENGVVNLINHMPQAAARHMVVSLTEVAEGFAARVRR